MVTEKSFKKDTIEKAVRKRQKEEREMCDTGTHAHQVYTHIMVQRENDLSRVFDRGGSKTNKLRNNCSLRG